MATIGRTSGTGLKATLEGGPQLAAALRNLELATSGPIAQGAVRAGLDVIRRQWAATVPIGNAVEGDDYPGAYQQEMSNPDVIRVGKPRGNATGGFARVRGTLGPRLRPSVPGVPRDSQPALYAPVLEFGGHVGRNHATYISPHGTARAAVDATASQAAEALGARLRSAFPR